MNETEVPNPFESARRIAALSVMLKPHDLTEACPDLHPTIAEHVLKTHGSEVAVAMITAGVKAALAIIGTQGESA